MSKIAFCIGQMFVFQLKWKIILYKTCKQIYYKDWRVAML